MKNYPQNDEHANSQIQGLLSLSPNELKAEAHKLTPIEIHQILLYIEGKPSHQTHFISLLEGLNQNKQLEAVGQSASIDQLISFLKHIHPESKEHFSKLSPLLVGLSTGNFIELIAKVDDKQLEVLNLQSNLEPLQHQLTNLVHVLTAKEDQIIEDSEHLSHFILSITPSEFTPEQLSYVQNQITLIKNKVFTIIDIVKKALFLAWNSGRTDLVDKLTSLKDHFHRILNEEVGEAAMENRTGLFQLLQDHLATVFESTDDHGHSTRLTDDDPAFEGLASLGLIYITDWWKAGLLPSVKNEKDLDGVSQPVDTEIESHFLQEMRDQLTHLKLLTVKDLKKNLICSLPMLQEYVTRDTKS